MSNTHEVTEFIVAVDTLSMGNVSRFVLPCPIQMTGKDMINFCYALKGLLMPLYDDAEIGVTTSYLQSLVLSQENSVTFDDAGVEQYTLPLDIPSDTASDFAYDAWRESRLSI